MIRMDSCQSGDCSRGLDVLGYGRTRLRAVIDGSPSKGLIACYNGVVFESWRVQYFAATLRTSGHSS